MRVFLSHGSLRFDVLCLKTHSTLSPLLYHGFENYLLSHTTCEPFSIITRVGARSRWCKVIHSQPTSASEEARECTPILNQEREAHASTIVNRTRRISALIVQTSFRTEDRLRVASCRCLWTSLAVSSTGRGMLWLPTKYICERRNGK